MPGSLPPSAVSGCHAGGQVVAGLPAVTVAARLSLLAAFPDRPFFLAFKPVCSFCLRVVSALFARDKESPVFSNEAPGSL